jgi:hypothetical protein
MGKYYTQEETDSEARSRVHAEEALRPTEEESRTGNYSKPGSGPSLTSVVLGWITGKNNE